MASQLGVHVFKTSQNRFYKRKQTSLNKINNIALISKQHSFNDGEGGMTILAPCTYLKSPLESVVWTHIYIEREHTNSNTYMTTIYKLILSINDLLSEMLPPKTLSILISGTMFVFTWNSSKE